jgi:hypothetical protein
MRVSGTLIALRTARTSNVFAYSAFTANARDVPAEFDIVQVAFRAAIVISGAVIVVSRAVVFVSRAVVVVSRGVADSDRDGRRET